MKTQNDPNSATNHDPLSRSQLVSYALPNIGINFLFGPIVILQGIYAKHFGMALTTIATVLFVARLFDAVTDPLVGYCSDRYYARKGTRKPFIVAGALLLLFSSYYLYGPPENVGTAYFAFWFFAFYLAWTVFEIPHNAWAGELIQHSGERNKIYMLRSAVSSLGSTAFFALPLLFAPLTGTTEFTPQSLKWSVIIAGALLLPMLYACIKCVPNGRHIQELPMHHGSGGAVKPASFARLLIDVIKNKPFMIFVAAFMFSGAGLGMFSSMLFIYVDAFLGLGEKLPLVYLMSMMLNVLSMLVWYKFAARLGKMFTWAAGMIIMIVGVLSMGLLMPGEGSFYALMALMALIFFGAASLSITPSILADIIDYGCLKSGNDSAATYFSVYALLTKINAAIGGALGLAIAGWYGFDATQTTHTQKSVFGAHLSIAYLPALITLISLVFIVLTPINARRHALIRRRLDKRAARAKSDIKPRESSQSVVSPV